MSGARASGETVVRRSGRGWVVGDEEASDLTSAMVLADLLAADLAPSGSAPPAPRPRLRSVLDAGQHDRRRHGAEPARRRRPHGPPPGTLAP